MFINEGNDVTNAQQMKDALLSHGGIEGVRVAVSDSLEESVTGELPKIVGMSKLNTHRLEGVCCRRGKAARVHNNFRFVRLL